MEETTAPDQFTCKNCVKVKAVGDHFEKDGNRFCCQTCSDRGPIHPETCQTC